jgi:hypothetical protein
MKIARISFYLLSSAVVVSCGGYTDEQSKAADKFCTCMEQEGDFDINFYNCDVQIVEEFGGEIMADEGWGLALEEKCPSVAGQIAESE